MTTQGEIRQRRIEWLLDQLEAAATTWAEAKYQDGLDSGRRGVVSAGARKGRDQAELKFKGFLRQLRQAVKRPRGQ